ncbi:60S ribosomal protein L21A [Microbotryomycetes sp. JL201]|nr:60S ribosomal protein L21A [Microbotryomycetes sp. JL201]
MPHSFGYRARTRDMFKRGFKQHGSIPLSTYMRTYRVGDIVDIKANAAQQKGMPHKYYHGRTGIVYNVTKTSVGVIVYKVVGNRYMEKRVNLRVEHVKHSKCRDDFLNRVKSNAAAKKEAKAKGEHVLLKRLPAAPRESRLVVTADNAPQTLAPIAYPLQSATAMSAAGPSGDRQQLVQNAVTFLRDPSAQQSPLAQRVSFLESKGLTPQEIELALAQAHSNAAQPTTMYSQRGPFAPATMTREFERDWRDWFIMAVVGSAVGYIATKLARKYVVPHLQPPSESELEAAQKALEAKYDEAAEVLKTLQQSTDALAASLDEQKQAIDTQLDQVKQGVAEMKEGERRREEWSKKVQDQVDDVARNLPSLIEKQSSTHAQQLTELQTELKSLKSLLIARRPTPTTSASGTTTSTIGNSSFPGSGSGGAAPSSSASTGGSITPTGQETGRVSPSGLGVRKPGIPAWQMRGSSAATLAGSTQPLPSSTPSSSTDSAAGDATASKAPEDTSASGILVHKEDATPSNVSSADAASATAGTDPKDGGMA